MGAITFQGPPYGESVSRCPAERSRKEIHRRGGTQSLGLNLSSLSVQKTYWPSPHSHTPTGPGLGILYGHWGTLLLSWKMPSIVRKCHVTWDTRFPAPALNCAMHPAKCTGENEDGEERML